MQTHGCKLVNDFLMLEVAALGAEMQYLRLRSGHDLLWHGDSAYWSGRAPLLFPIVGRAVNDVVYSGGVHAVMQQHGFARRQVFALEHASQKRCEHVLRASKATREVYPFDFQITVIHEIRDATLSVSAEIANKGIQPMPFGFGFHPAFTLPIGNDDEPHYIMLSESRKIEQQPLQPDGLLDRKLVPGPFDEGQFEVSDQHFEHGALVFPNGAEPLRYGPRGGPHLDLKFDNLPDLAFWRPVGAPFLCIEPWHGTSSIVDDEPDIEKRPNSVVLQAGEVRKFAYHVTYNPTQSSKITGR